MKTREIDDATVNYHNPFGIVAYALMLFSWTTFVETAVYRTTTQATSEHAMKSWNDKWAVPSISTVRLKSTQSTRCQTHTQTNLDLELS